MKVLSPTRKAKIMERGVDGDVMLEIRRRFLSLLDDYQKYGIDHSLDEIEKVAVDTIQKAVRDRKKLEPTTD